MPRAAPADLANLDRAVNLIADWTVRRDVQQETMRRARCELSRAQVWLLHRLDSCAPTRLSDLAVDVGLECSTLSPQVQRLERDGLVVRDADPSDRRAALLRVTRLGHNLLGRLRQARESMLADAFAGWTSEDLSWAALHLARISDALGRP